MIRGFVVCGEIGQACPVKCVCPNMTEKMLTFPSPTPSPTSPDPGDGVLRSKFNFFPVQHQHNPTPPKIFVPGHHARTQEFFVGGGGGGRGVGVEAPQLILQFKEGVQWFYYTFSWGVQLFPGVGVQ